MRRSFCLLAIVLSFVATTPSSSATPSPKSATCAADAGWHDPAVPRRVFGNTWFVGTCGLSAILITSPQGHVLIDGATDQAAPLIEANIRALGFELRDIKHLLNSHEHFDHAGGLARLQASTGASVRARGPAVTVLRFGRSARNDPQYGVADSYPPVARVENLSDDGVVTLGQLRLQAHATPGHTPGSTSWTWTSCEDNVCRRIVYADSLTAISDDQYRYSDDQAHPGYLADFRRSIDAVAALPCDILLTPHPSASGLWSRLGPAATESLVDAAACRTYAENAKGNLDARLAKEAGAATP